MKCSKSSVVFQTCADAEKLSAVSTPSLMTCCSVSVDRQVEDQMLPYHVFFRARVLAIMLRSSMGAHETSSVTRIFWWLVGDSPLSFALLRDAEITLDPAMAFFVIPCGAGRTWMAENSNKLG